MALASNSLFLLALLLGCLLRGVEPGDGRVDRGHELGLVASVELVGKLLVVDQVAEVVSVRLETVLGSGGLTLS